MLEDLDIYYDRLNMTKLEKTFKLGSLINTTNMVLYNTDGYIKKYKDVNDIITEYCGKRLEYYQLRIDYIIDGLNKEIDILRYKVKFIEEFINNTIKIIKTKKEDITKQLEDKKYPKINDNWDYLLKMPIYNLSQEKIDELLKQLENKESELEYITSQTPKSLWKLELDELLTIFIKKGYNNIKNKNLQINLIITNYSMNNIVNYKKHNDSEINKPLEQTYTCSNFTFINSKDRK